MTVTGPLSIGTYALLRDSKQAVQTGFPNKLCIVSTQNTRDFFLWFVWKHYMQSLFGNSVWTACLESCLEDRPTDRLLEAPSRSLKRGTSQHVVVGKRVFWGKGPPEFTLSQY